MNQVTPAQMGPQTISPLPQDSGSVLALGVEVHRLTACLLEPVPSKYRLTAWWIAPPGLHRSVAEQIQDLCERFGNRLRRRLWDEERDAPFTYSPDPVGYPPLQHVTIVASPRPRVRVWVAGLTEQNSLAAAVGALESSQAHVIGATALRASDDSQSLAHELNATRPDALVLAGGYDSGESGTQRSLSLLTRYIALALHALPDDAMPKIIFAGNPFAYRDVAAILQSVRPCQITRVNNVLPSPGRTYAQSLAQAADTLYRQKCESMRGFARLAEWTTDSAPISTIESSFIRLVRSWRELHDLPELHAVYTRENRWLHVWADAGAQQVLVRFLPPGPSPEIAGTWPPLRLVSGPWIEDEELPESVLWWDSGGLAPVTAAAAIVAPRAAVQALQADLLVRPGR
jgi:hypothetical protein